MRVLIVNDHEELVWVVRETFLASHDVEVVHSLVDARKLLSTSEFDVLLLDYDLPDGKGVELLSAQGEPLPPLVVAISSHTPGNAALIRAGASAMCAKADFAEIQQVLASATATT